MQCILAEGQAQSLTVVKSEDLRVSILGGDSPAAGKNQGDICPDVQKEPLLSAYILSSGRHGVLGLCLMVLSEVTGFWLSDTALGVVGILTKLVLHV